LPEKQARVYLAALELGDALASEISLKSGLPRTLVYDILEKLERMGLVSHAVKNNTKYFRAADPRELLRILVEKREAVEEVMPQLRELQVEEGTKKPRVEVYVGKEGMKTVMDDILRSGVKEFLSYGSSGSSFKVIPAFIAQWHRRRIRQGVEMRIIYNNTKQARERVRSMPESMQKARHKFMPIDLESPTATMTYGEKVVIQSWTKEPFAVMIESRELAENQRHYFEALWKIARS